MGSVDVAALLGNRAMFTLAVEGCDELLRVVRFGGHEGISSLFDFRLEVASSTFSLDILVGKSALLTIEGVDGPRYIHGYVCEAGYFGESTSYTLYELILVPMLWRLGQRVSSRIFQGIATPRILTSVLEGAGLPRSQYRLELQGSYVPRDYCVQYHESDLDFISRLMEADGIYYYFEHKADKEVLVMTDRSEGGPPIEGDDTLRFADQHQREHISSFRVSEGVRPQRVSLRDKSLHQPHQSLAVSEGAGELEVYLYPGSYQEAGKGGAQKGGQQARLRLEALRADHRRAFGTSDSPRLLPGHVFSVADASRGHLEGAYRVVSVSHRGEQPQSLDEGASGGFHYSNNFECTDRKVPYRAPRITPRPAVRGAQTATVVGPGSEEIHVDEHGRVKVQFHWDRRDVHDDSSSCWVRVSQMWAGNGFGTMFLPRVGHEVIVDFLEGDPDRPIITGRIYTGFNQTPYPLPDEKTKSTIRSESSPGGGGSNELRFEDAKGSEEVFLHGQKDLNIVVENDKGQRIGHDERLSVGHDRSKTVTHDQTEVVGNNQTITVGSMHNETIGVNMSLTVGATLSVAVGGSAVLGVGGGGMLTIDGSKNEAVSGDSSTAVGGGQQLSVGGSASEAIGGGKGVDVAGDSAESVGGGKSVSVAQNLTQSAGKNIALSASKHLNVSSGENLNMSAGKNAAVVVAEKMTLKCGDATVTIQKNGDITIQSKKLNIKASGDVTVQGANVKLN